MMKNSILVTAILLLASSCTPFKFVSLVGSYPQAPFIFSSDKPREKVWDNVVDLFAQKGISIKIIDKGSGLIISEPTALSWSYEDKNGKLVNPSAQVAIYKKINNMSGRTVDPVKVFGEWNIRIKDNDGKTSINVNIVNIKHEDSYVVNYRLEYRTEDYQENAIRSTGNFEKTIADYVK